MADPITGALQAAAPIVQNLLSRADAAAQKQRDTSQLLRLLYLETLHNLEVLNTLESEKLRVMKPDEPSFCKLLALLSTEVAEAVFFQETGTELFDRLKKKGKLPAAKTEACDSNDETTYENVLQALSFVTVKLEFLRKLSGLTPDERDLFHHCKLNIRIDNLARRFQLIMKVLGEFEEIQSMAR